MKKLILTLICFISIYGLFAQESPSKPPYLRYPSIPSFTLVKLDSSKMTRNDLPKNRKTMIMYFSPTCDHCQVQTDSMIHHMNKFKDVEIVMASYSSIAEMKRFYEDRQLARFKNIKMGYDSKYFFPPFYKMMNLPFMALYNKKGNFITSFQGNASIQNLVEAFERK